MEVGLILQHCPGEQIIIGNRSIIITVVSVRGDKVRIGIKAPKELTVHRREVLEKIQHQSFDGGK